jgi:hypothetical protein
MKKHIFLLLLFSFCLNSFSQEVENLKTQTNPFLSNFYFSVNFGGIFYPFSNENLLEGYETDTFSRNFFSGRLLLGYKLNKSLSMQFGTMRPAAWFQYDNVNNIGYKRSVWINAWSLSLKQSFSINKKLSAFGELGAANVTRVGFEINDKTIYPDAHFGSILYSFGLNYKFNEKWRLSLNSTFIPESKTHNQPSISQVSAGFEYHLQKLPKEKVIENANNDYFFPENILQFSYGTSELGFGVNRFFGMSLHVGSFESFGIPVFWVGEVKATNTYSITYQRLAFRTRKTFSLDWGVSVSAFQTTETTEPIFAFSVFPTLRFYLLRKENYDMYTNYSVIGPAYLTKANIDNLKSGPRITFHDTMGLGFFFGEKRKYNIEFRIMHYSNGNNFTENSGIAVPVQLTLGKTF